MQSTEKIVTLNGLTCRVWEGRTANGVPCHAYIPRIAVKEGLTGNEYAEFLLELQECAKPSADVAAIPARIIL